MKIAVIPGSFDPVTRGHVDLAERAAVLFDKVIVVAMINDEKQYYFTAEERVAFLKDAVQHIPNVSVDYSEGMLYEYVTRQNACAIVKGVRNGKDTDYELWMAEYNREHAPHCDTLLLPADKKLTRLSSTEVKRLAQEGENIDALVTPMVAQALRNHKKE